MQCRITTILVHLQLLYGVDCCLWVSVYISIINIIRPYGEHHSDADKKFKWKYDQYIINYKILKEEQINSSNHDPETNFKKFELRISSANVQIQKLQNKIPFPQTISERVALTTTAIQRPPKRKAEKLKTKPLLCLCRRQQRVQRFCFSIVVCVFFFILH